MKSSLTESDYIRFSQLAVKRFPKINKMLSLSNYRKWESKLKEEGPETFQSQKTIFNLLTTSAIVGFSIKQKVHNANTEHPERLLTKLEMYLECFPSLATNKSFKGKITNLDRFCFLSTMSELSLSYHLKQSGFCITFEHPFINLSTKTSKDLDITISDREGSRVHLEVYTPLDQIEINGFFDPKGEDHHYTYKIEKKLSDKFGTNGLSGINGEILLAVNSAFMDSIQIRNVVPGLKPIELYQEITTHLPADIGGILIFKDAFDSIDSLEIEEIYLKKGQYNLPTNDK